MSTPILKLGSTGSNVKKLQAVLGVAQDGELGKITWSAWRHAFVTKGGWGFTGSTQRARRRWNLVMGVSAPTAAEKRRAAKLVKKYGTGVLAARAFYKRYVGKKESPPGSNRGSWGLSSWEASFGFSGAPWCGIAVGKALQAAGVKGITSRVASVYLILSDGLAGRNGFSSCVYRRSTGHGSVKNIRSGDVVGIGGESTHVEWVDEVTSTGVWNFGGNTSSGDGSVSDGGMLARKFRPWSAVVYGVRPSYPKA